MQTSNFIIVVCYIFDIYFYKWWIHWKLKNKDLQLSFLGCLPPKTDKLSWNLDSSTFIGSFWTNLGDMRICGREKHTIWRNIKLLDMRTRKPGTQSQVNISWNCSATSSKCKPVWNVWSLKSNKAIGPDDIINCWLVQVCNY